MITKWNWFIFIPLTGQTWSREKEEKKKWSSHFDAASEFLSAGRTKHFCSHQVFLSPPKNIQQPFLFHMFWSPILKLFFFVVNKEVYCVICVTQLVLHKCLKKNMQINVFSQSEWQHSRFFSSSQRIYWCLTNAKQQNS